MSARTDGKKASAAASVLAKVAAMSVARRLHTNTYNMSCSLPGPLLLPGSESGSGLCARCYANMFVLSVCGMCVGIVMSVR